MSNEVAWYSGDSRRKVSSVKEKKKRRASDKQTKPRNFSIDLESSLKKIAHHSGSLSSSRIIGKGKEGDLTWVIYSDDPVGHWHKRLIIVKGIDYDETADDGLERKPLRVSQPSNPLLTTMKNPLHQQYTIQRHPSDLAEAGDSDDGSVVRFGQPSCLLTHLSSAHESESLHSMAHSSLQLDKSQNKPKTRSTMDKAMTSDISIFNAAPTAPCRKMDSSVQSCNTFPDKVTQKPKYGVCRTYSDDMEASMASDIQSVLDHSVEDYRGQGSIQSTTMQDSKVAEAYGKMYIKSLHVSLNKLSDLDQSHADISIDPLNGFKPRKDRFINNDFDGEDSQSFQSLLLSSTLSKDGNANKRLPSQFNRSKLTIGAPSLLQSLVERRYSDDEDEDEEDDDSLLFEHDTNQRKRYQRESNANYEVPCIPRTDSPVEKRSSSDSLNHSLAESQDCFMKSPINHNILPTKNNRSLPPSVHQLSNEASEKIHHAYEEPHCGIDSYNELSSELSAIPSKSGRTLTSSTDDTITSTTYGVNIPGIKNITVSKKKQNQEAPSRVPDLQVNATFVQLSLEDSKGVHVQTNEDVMSTHHGELDYESDEASIDILKAFEGSDDEAEHIEPPQHRLAPSDNFNPREKDNIIRGLSNDLKVMFSRKSHSSDEEELAQIPKRGAFAKFFKRSKIMHEDEEGTNRSFLRFGHASYDNIQLFNTRKGKRASRPDVLDELMDDGSKASDAELQKLCHMSFDSLIGTSSSFQKADIRKGGILDSKGSGALNRVGQEKRETFERSDNRGLLEEGTKAKSTKVAAVTAVKESHAEQAERRRKFINYSHSSLDIQRGSSPSKNPRGRRGRFKAVKKAQSKSLERQSCSPINRRESR